MYGALPSVVDLDLRLTRQQPKSRRRDKTRLRPLRRCLDTAELRWTQVAPGFDAMWTSETYSSDAITPLAYIAALTKKIRLGMCAPRSSRRALARTSGRQRPTASDPKAEVRRAGYDFDSVRTDALHATAINSLAARGCEEISCGTLQP